LLEKVIASQPNLAYIDEPLNWKRFFTNRTSIKPNYQYIYSDPERQIHIKKYFDDIFNNKITIHFPLAFWSKSFCLKPNRYVVKFINGKELINWFEENYNIKVVYMLRHPIATALSRINWRWQNINDRFSFMFNDEIFLERAPSSLVGYAKKMLQKGSEIEKNVTGWCLENYVPLKHLDQTNWLFTSYENLLINPEIECKILKNSLNLSNSSLMLQQINSPSGSVSAYKNTNKLMTSSDSDSKKYLAEKWRTKISDEDEEKAFEILNTFEIDIYPKGMVMPNFSKSVKNRSYKSETG